MNPKLYGWQHITYLVVFLTICAAVIVCAKLFIKTEKQKAIFVKCLGAVLLVAIVTNRFSIVHKTAVPEWKWIVPDSFCGFSSLVLALATIFGKKDNDVLQFVWLMALAGGTITTFYPDFLGQHPSFMYLPTISGLLHHGISALVVVVLFLLGYLKISYKRWYCVLFGFTCMITFGCFLMSVCNFHDAYCIVSPVMNGTPLTVWVIAPIYIFVYAIVVVSVELYRKYHKKNGGEVLASVTETSVDTSAQKIGEADSPEEKAIETKKSATKPKTQTEKKIQETKQSTKKSSSNKATK